MQSRGQSSKSGKNGKGVVQLYYKANPQRVENEVVLEETDLHGSHFSDLGSVVLTELASSAFDI